MIKTKIFLIAVIVGAFSAAASIYVIRDRQSEETAVSSTFDAATSQPPTSEGEVQPREPEGISEAVEGGAPLSELPPLVVNRPSPARKDSSSASVKAVAKKTVTKTVAVESKGSPSQPPALQPIEPAQTQSGSEGSVSEPLSLVLPPKELPPVKLCGGQSVSQCADVEFSHFDFALLILDIISIKGIKEDEEIFDVLESVSIQPVMGWARSDPQKRITTREMEEVRCSISRTCLRGGSVGLRRGRA